MAQLVPKLVKTKKLDPAIVRLTNNIPSKLFFMKNENTLANTKVLNSMIDAIRIESLYNRYECDSFFGSGSESSYLAVAKAARNPTMRRYNPKSAISSAVYIRVSIGEIRYPIACAKTVPVINTITDFTNSPLTNFTS